MIPKDPIFLKFQGWKFLIFYHPQHLVLVSCNFGFQKPVWASPKYTRPAL